MEETIRVLLFAAVLCSATISIPISTTTFAQQAAKFSTASSTINELIADPAAKAVLEKHVPQIVQAAGQIGGQTLKQLQGMAPDRLTDQLLATIDAELAKIK